MTAAQVTKKAQPKPLKPAKPKRVIYSRTSEKSCSPKSTIKDCQKDFNGGIKTKAVVPRT